MSAFIPLFFFVFILGLMVAMFVFGYQQWKKSVAAWAQAAAELDLTSAASSMFEQSSMTGRVRDVDVRIHTERRSTSGNDNKKAFTVYTVNYFADSPPVVIKRERGLGIVRRLVGTRDIEIGDPVFDDALVIDSDDATGTAAFLTPTRRRAIFSLMEAWPTAELSNTRIMVANPGLETRSERIVSTINRLVDTAHVLGSPARVDAALELEAQGDLADGAAALAEINASPDYADNSYTRLLEAQAQMSLGERDRVSELLDELEPVLPDDAEVMALRDMIARPAPAPLPVSALEPDPAPAPAPPPTGEPERPPEPDAGPEPAPVPEAVLEEPTPDPEPSPEPAEPEPAGSAAVPTGADAVIADLFGSNRLGHDVETRFDEVYRGQRVRWSGTVERVRPYRGDRDFGAAPGTKVTVLVGHLGDGRLVTSRVEAVVQLPADVALERGAEIEFAGTLLRVDRFMRNLYVADAQLESR